MSSYIQTLYQDGSLLTILTYLYSHFLTDFSTIISNSLSNLLQSIDINIIIQFLTTANEFQFGTAITTHGFFYSFLIPFYSRLFSNLGNETQPEEFLIEIDKFKFIPYLNSFIDNYILIFQEDDWNSHNVHNKDLLDILNIFTSHYKDLFEFNLHFDLFIEIIAKIISISDGLYQHQIEWIHQLISFLIQEEKSDELDLLKQFVISGIVNRVQHHSKFLLITPKQEYILNPNFYFEFIFELVSPMELLDQISIQKVEDINIFIGLLMSYIHIKKDDASLLIMNTIQYYHELFHENCLFSSFWELFVCLKYNQSEFIEISKSPLLDEMTQILFENQQTDFPVQTETIFEFCELFGQFIVNQPYLKEILTIGSTSHDIVLIKAVLIIIQTANKTTSNEFLHQLIHHMNELTPNEELILMFSPYLIDFNFMNNYEIWELIKKWIELIKPLSLKNEESLPLEFDDKFIQIQFCLINFLSKNFGFSSCDYYLDFIKFILDKYGMCIETLNVLSIIIGNLIHFVHQQLFPVQMKLTNEMIYSITSKLIENLTSNQLKKSFDIPKDSYILMFTFLDNVLSDFDYEEDLFEFCNCKHSYLYSFYMNGQNIGHKFHYLVNLNEESQFLVSREKKLMFHNIATCVSQSFIRNLAIYSIMLLDKFGFDEFYVSSKLIIKFAIRNSLLPSESLEMFLNALSKDLLNRNDDEIQFWINELTQRVSSLINLRKAFNLELIVDRILQAMEKKNENVDELKCIASFFNSILEQGETHYD